jgi:hypothetical protein
MFLYQLTNDFSKIFGFDYYSINKDEYHDQIKSLSWKKFIEEKSNNKSCFGPIRAGGAEPTIPKDLESYSIVLHLRDPRDVLVSLFYSYTYSHPRRPERFNPSDKERFGWEEGGINAFVIEKAPEYKKRYQSLTSTLFEKKNVVFIRYEEMVSDYGTWLKKFLSAFSHFSVPPKRTLRPFKRRTSLADIQQKFLKKYKKKFTVSSEDIYRHKRQIAPGDHKRKLKEDTIKRLTFEFKDILKLLNYEPESAVLNRLKQ